MAQTLSGLRQKWIYKKVDSCLRGNSGAETDVLLDALRFDAALIAPALDKWEIAPAVTAARDTGILAEVNTMRSWPCIMTRGIFPTKLLGFHYEAATGTWGR